MSQSDPLTQLEHWAEPLLKKLAPAKRKQLTRELGIALRRNQQQRIKQQRNPDGSHYAPRKQRAKAGRIKGEVMFKKLRQSKYLKQKQQPDGIAIGFFGKVANIARVHQQGLKDRPSPDAAEVKYDRRELIGFSDADRELIRDKLLEYLSA